MKFYRFHTLADEDMQCSPQCSTLSGHSRAIPSLPTHKADNRFSLAHSLLPQPKPAS